MPSPARTVVCLALALTLGLAAPLAAADAPPVFSKMTFEEGKAVSKSGQKVFVVKATAEWCGPCKMMNKSTFRDQKIEGWFKDNGVVIEVDVDKQPALAKELKISAMPTMVAFKDGKEFDRVVGYRDAGGLLAWLEAVKKGEKATDAVERTLEKAQRGEGRIGMRERLNLARSLAQGGKHEKATEEFLWLWNNMVKEEPAMTGVRGSFMASNMQQLAAEHEPARKAFAEIRDELETRLKGENKSWDDLDDWIVLNDVVGDQARTLEWFDRIKGDPGAAPTLERFGFRIERLLEEHERWADMARLTRDPLRKLRQEHGQLEMILKMPMGGADQAQKAEMEETVRGMFRDKAAKLYAGLLAADRDGDAAKLAAEAFKLDNGPAMKKGLVEMSLRASEARPEHRAWLEEAGRAGEAVDGIMQDLERAVGGT